MGFERRVKRSNGAPKENSVIYGQISGISKCLLQQTARLMVLVAAILVAPLQSSGQGEVRSLTPAQVDEIVDHLQAAVQNYVFPDIATKLQEEIKEHRAQYRTISDPTALAERLTSDMRAVGNDYHLAVTFSEGLAVRKDLTPEENQHAHAFDRASGYGARSARRLPGNIGYIDLAYFSPDPDAGVAIAATMQLIAGTDVLILDLRRNGGGSGETETALISYFFGDSTQLSSVVEQVDGKIQERQHWTTPYLQGPRYLGKPVFILTSNHTHSAAEVLVYDLKNMHLATTVGERTSGEATSATGEIDLGYHFSTFIPNGQLISPITHGNYNRIGVQPNVPTAPTDALVTAYTLALKEARWNVDSDELKKERASAIQDPKAALLEEIEGLPRR
jgi:retinol-binding protein 3